MNIFITSGAELIFPVYIKSFAYSRWKHRHGTEIEVHSENNGPTTKPIHHRYFRVKLLYPTILIGIYCLNIENYGLKFDFHFSHFFSVFLFFRRLSGLIFFNSPPKNRIYKNKNKEALAAFQKKVSKSYLRNIYKPRPRVNY
uniref:Uncharacterized protein n=1 Tax=Rhizophagus irregularis (strain DAOM 181602 / DAOM 197198 / MUCL 43194) TaxID=747089 RepID=U9V7C0_RHIID